MLLCQFLVLAGNRLWWEIVFGVTYVLSVQYSCAVVSVFLLWREMFITTEKKKFKSSVWRVCDRYYDRKKKVLVAIVITTGKKKF